MDFGERERSGPEVNIAPLIDVVFLLLVFFMLASSFVETRAIDLAISQADSASVPAPGEPLVVHVTADLSLVTLNGLRLTIDQLGAELAARIAGDPARAVTVNAAAEVPVQRLVSVMDAIGGAGTRNIRLATPGGG